MRLIVGIIVWLAAIPAIATIHGYDLNNPNPYAVLGMTGPAPIGEVTDAYIGAEICFSTFGNRHVLDEAYRALSTPAIKEKIDERLREEAAEQARETTQEPESVPSLLRETPPPLTYVTVNEEIMAEFKERVRNAPSTAVLRQERSRAIGVLAPREEPRYQWSAEQTKELEAAIVSRLFEIILGTDDPFERAQSLLYLNILCPVTSEKGMKNIRYLCAQLSDLSLGLKLGVLHHLSSVGALSPQIGAFIPNAIWHETIRQLMDRGETNFQGEMRVNAEIARMADFGDDVKLPRRGNETGDLLRSFLLVLTETRWSSVDDLSRFLELTRKDLEQHAAKLRRKVRMDKLKYSSLLAPVVAAISFFTWRLHHIAQALSGLDSVFVETTAIVSLAIGISSLGTWIYLLSPLVETSEGPRLKDWLRRYPCAESLAEQIAKVTPGRGEEAALTSSTSSSGTE